VLLARLASTGLGGDEVAGLQVPACLVCWQFLVAGAFAVILSGAFSPEFARIPSSSPPWEGR
jgi:hypothetical protein